MFLSPLLFIGLLLALIKSHTTLYTVTKNRVAMEAGLFSKSSQELRLQDIRSITAHRNLFGYGWIEFSTAATDEAEIRFDSIFAVKKVHDLVKSLQS